MNQTLVNIFTLLERIGLVDVLLPFALVFAIVYGILERVKVFGKDNRNANLIVAMVMGFLVVGVINYVNIINDIVRLFGLIVIMIICFALIYGLFGKDLAFIKKKTGSGGDDKGSSGSEGKKSDGKDSGKGGSSPADGYSTRDWKPGDKVFRE